MINRNVFFPGLDGTRESPEPDLQPDLEADGQGAEDPQDVRQLRPALLQQQRIRTGRGGFR